MTKAIQRRSCLKNVNFRWGRLAAKLICDSDQFRAGSDSDSRQCCKRKKLYLKLNVLLFLKDFQNILYKNYLIKR